MKEIKTNRGDYLYTKDKDRKVWFSQGVDYGGKITLIAEDDQYLLFRVSGHTGWSGRGSTKYYSSYYLIYNNKTKTIRSIEKI